MPRLRLLIQFLGAALAFGLLFLLALAPGQAEQSRSSMSSGDINRLVIGKQLDWKSLDGSLNVFGSIIFRSDGKVVMTTNLPGLAKDEGQWWFDQDRLCTRWSAARDGEAKCYHLIDQGAGRFLSTGGNLFEVGGDPMV
jgi:hypothetical protein